MDELSNSFIQNYYHKHKNSIGRSQMDAAYGDEPNSSKYQTSDHDYQPDLGQYGSKFDAII